MNKNLVTQIKSNITKIQNNQSQQNNNHLVKKTSLIDLQ